MKRILLLFSLLLLLAAAMPQRAMASHLQAADITYRWIGPNQYRIYLRLNCDRTTGSASVPTSATISWRDARSSSCSEAGNAILQPLFAPTFDTLGSNVCTSVLQQYNGQPTFGSTIIVFSGTIMLPSQSDSWIVSFSLNARPNLSNLSSGGTEDLYTYAVINNSTVAGQYDVRNTSIQYANNPASSLAESKQSPLSFYTCVGQPYEINFNYLNPTYGQFSPGEAQQSDAALTPQADSLVFSLVPAMAPRGAGAPACARNLEYFRAPGGTRVTNLTVIDSVTNGSLSASWELDSFPAFSPTWPLPSHTWESRGINPAGVRVYYGSPYFFIDRNTGRMSFRPSMYNVNNVPTASSPTDKYTVAVLIEEYRKIRLNKIDGQGQSFTKDTTIFVGAVRRELMVYVSDCAGNIPPRMSSIEWSSPQSPSTATVRDSLTRIVVPSCDSLFYAMLKYAATGSGNNTAGVSWLNPFPNGSKFKGAVSPTIVGNNSQLATLFIVVPNPASLAQTASGRDSVDLLLRLENQQCPHPSQAFNRVRLVFERADSIPGPAVIASGPTLFCEGDSVTLTAQGGTNWRWSTGDTTSSIVVRRSGTYAVRSVYGACSSYPRQVVSVVVTPFPAIGPIRQSPNTLEVNALPNVTYEWMLNGQPVGSNSPVLNYADTGTYQVRAIASGCVTTDTIVVSPMADQISGLLLYPNPARNRVRLKSGQEVQYRILNALGQPVAEGELKASQPAEVDIRSWPIGLYIVHTHERKHQYLVVE